jgi:hypothetical protein
MAVQCKCGEHKGNSAKLLSVNVAKRHGPLFLYNNPELC